MKADAINKILSATRRRLWLETLLMKLRLAIWVGSACLLTIALASVFVTPVAPIHAALASIIVAGSVILTTLRHRPSLRHCALKADRYLETDSLLTSALEVRQLTTAALSPAGHVVLRQATEAAPQWQEHIDGVWQAPAPSGYALATIPVFAAILLLSFASTQGETASANGAVASDSQYLLDSNDDVLELRDTIVRDSDRNDNIRNSDRPMNDDSTLASVAAAPQNSDKQSALAKPGTTAPELDAEKPGDGREAGDALPTRGADGLRPDTTEPSLAGRSAVQIARRGESIAGFNASDTKFDDATVAAFTARVRAAAAPPTRSSRTTLTPAQIAYAEQYLERTEKQRD